MKNFGKNLLTSAVALMMGVNMMGIPVMAEEPADAPEIVTSEQTAPAGTPIAPNPDAEDDAEVVSPETDEVETADTETVSEETADATEEATDATTEAPVLDTSAESKNYTPVIIASVAGVAVIAGAAVIISKKHHKNSNEEK